MEDALHVIGAIMINGYQPGGIITIYDSSFIGNGMTSTTSTLFRGGAIACDPAEMTLTLVNTTFSDHQLEYMKFLYSNKPMQGTSGGVIHSKQCHVIMRGCTAMNNLAHSGTVC